MCKVLHLRSVLVLLAAVLGLGPRACSSEEQLAHRIAKSFPQRLLRGPVPQRSYFAASSEELTPSALSSKRCSWIEEYKRAELLARSPLSPSLPAQDSSSRHLAMIQSPNVDSASFVSPEASAQPACCPNAPMKKTKSMRRRPDDENENSAVAWQLPLARKLCF